MFEDYNVATRLGSVHKLATCRTRTGRTAPETRARARKSDQPAASAAGAPAASAAMWAGIRARAETTPTLFLFPLNDWESPQHVKKPSLGRCRNELEQLVVGPGDKRGSGGLDVGRVQAPATAS